ncbi:hypothetical protein Ahu01nite_049950 [Winogradskya humida]|uniref:Uncharacterized protein n=1 Tax=Winogradskya humida TaxID=113566 RepID=A0ABQ3ZTV9_9ACTN|nr:hypothetical protein Ahu01nite_049950 [Actinoplanes humidus]
MCCCGYHLRGLRHSLLGASDVCLGGTVSAQYFNAAQLTAVGQMARLFVEFLRQHHEAVHLLRVLGGGVQEVLSPVSPLGGVDVVDIGIENLLGSP